ncbi:MAG: hypothetical protein IJS65_06055 [Clostridia bacterium]|nr:hypothetical protein [Clostridia bacterium]
MRTVVLLFIIILFMFIPAFAVWNDTSKLDNALSSEESELIDGTTAKGAELRSGTKSLFRKAIELFGKKLKTACISSFRILGVCVLCGAVKGYCDLSKTKLTEKALDFTMSLGVAYNVIRSGVIAQSAKAAGRLCGFSKILTPAFAVACAVSKHPASAVSCGSAALLFTDFITSVTQNLIFPAITLYAVSACFSQENAMMGNVGKVIKWSVNTFYKIVLVVFTVYISFSGIISAGADALSLKTAKMVISGSIPVVGSVIADASDTILSGAVLLKNSIGVYGFLGACAICLAPIVSTFVYILCFKILGAVGGGLGGKSAEQIIGYASSAYSLCLTALGSCCAVQFIAIVVASAVSVS